MSNYDTSVYGTAVYGASATIVFTSVTASSITQTAATITWTTNVVASSQVSYGTTTAYGTNTAVTDTSPRVLAHSVTITGLTAGTTYHYAVTSVDGTSTSATSTDFSFTTTAAAFAVISGILTVRTQTTATITWNTDIIASSQVEYGLNIGYGTLSSLLDTSPRVLAHSVTISGLSPSTLYYFRVRSINGSAQESISSDNSFLTMAVVTVAGAIFPGLIVECDFTSNATAVPTWTDISTFVRGFSIRRGRQFELDRMDTGTLSILLSNQARRFDPANTASPYYPFLLPMRRIRIRAVWGGFANPIFNGFVESWPQQWEQNGRVAEVNLTAADGFSVFSRAQVNEFFPSELAGNRITSVLNAINWGDQQAWILGDATYGRLGVTTILGPVGAKIISAGLSTVQDSLLAGDNALDYIQSVTDTDNGIFFVDVNGNAVYRDRTARISSPYNASVATFGDGGGSELPYADLTLDTSPIYNEIRMTRVGGEEQVATDTVSRTQYYLRSRQSSGLLQTTDAEVATAAAYLLARYKDPVPRISSMTLLPARNPSTLWLQALVRDIGDRITIVRRPPGGGPTISQDSFIEGIEHEGSAHEWTTIFRTSPVFSTTY